nr:1,4-Dihydroxy-2-naphthoyl-CoA synthase, peroxisomal [Ipomoea batatas]
MGGRDSKKQPNCNRVFKNQLPNAVDDGHAGFPGYVYVKRAKGGNAAIGIDWEQFLSQEAAIYPFSTTKMKMHLAQSHVMQRHGSNLPSSKTSNSNGKVSLFVPLSLHFCHQSFVFGVLFVRFTLGTSISLLSKNKVAGYAVGGGHVLHMVCDLTIAADNAIFGRELRRWLWKFHNVPFALNAVDDGHAGLQFTLHECHSGVGRGCPYFYDFGCKIARLFFNRSEVGRGCPYFYDFGCKIARLMTCNLAQSYVMQWTTVRTSEHRNVVFLLFVAATGEGSDQQTLTINEAPSHESSENRKTVSG